MNVPVTAGDVIRAGLTKCVFLDSPDLTWRDEDGFARATVSCNHKTLHADLIRKWGVGVHLKFNNSSSRQLVRHAVAVRCKSVSVACPSLHRHFHTQIRRQDGLKHSTITCLNGFSGAMTLRNDTWSLDAIHTPAQPIAPGRKFRPANYTNDLNHFFSHRCFFLSPLALGPFTSSYQSRTSPDHTGRGSSARCANTEAADR